MYNVFYYMYIQLCACDPAFAEYDLIWSDACPLLWAFVILLFWQEFHRLQDENIQLKTICEDQEKALEELGSKLSEYVCFN